MKFLLIVVLSAMGGGGMNQWRQPAMTSGVFEDRRACEAAAKTLREEFAKWTREARIEYPAMTAMCFPTASQ